MLTINIAGIIILLIVFATEVVLILLQKPAKGVIPDIKSNFLLGMLVLLTGAFMKTVELGVYSFVYSFALFKPAMSVWLWIVALLGCEFAHYAFHWLGHKTQLFWGVHVIHHSSEEFNLSIGWRIHFLLLTYRFLFWAPLCFFGIPPLMILLISSITSMWNFLIHTKAVGKLGALDWLFNTPSNHRVHHGIQKHYLDKNLGGIFMIYDHLFGTYTKEDETPVYGITHNIHSHKPATILFHEFKSMARKLPQKKGIVAKVRYLLSPPE